MAQFTIDLPDELIKLAKSKFGMDVPTLVDSWLVKPLMDHYREEEKQAELSKVEPAITQKVEAVRGKIQFDKVNKPLDNGTVKK